MRCVINLRKWKKSQWLKLDEEPLAKKLFTEIIMWQPVWAECSHPNILSLIWWTVEWLKFNSAPIIPIVNWWSKCTRSRVCWHLHQFLKTKALCCEVNFQLALFLLQMHSTTETPSHLTKVCLCRPAEVLQMFSLHRFKVWSKSWWHTVTCVTHCHNTQSKPASHYKKQYGWPICPNEILLSLIVYLLHQCCLIEHYATSLFTLFTHLICYYRGIWCKTKQKLLFRTPCI